MNSKVFLNCLFVSWVFKNTRRCVTVHKLLEYVKYGRGYQWLGVLNLAWLLFLIRYLKGYMYSVTWSTKFGLIVASDSLPII